MNSELDGKARPEKSGSNKNKLRKDGMIPAVVYGKNVGSMSIAVDAKELKKILKEAGSNALISMKVSEDGKTKKYKVLVKSLQRDPVKRESIIHADFHQVSLKDIVHTTVPVHLDGTAPGVIAGGILTPLMRRIDVECLATLIPDAIKVDISGLDIGDAVTVSELITPLDVKILEDPHAPVVTITAADKAPVEAEIPVEEDKTEAEEGKDESEAEDR